MINKTKLELAIIVFIAIFILASFHNASDGDSICITKTITELNGKRYEVNVIIIDSKTDFFHGAGNWKMEVKNGDMKAQSFMVINKLKSEIIFNPDSISRLEGYFTSDAFEGFKKSNVEIYFGYNTPNTLAAKDINIISELKPLPSILKPIKRRKLTNALLEKLKLGNN